ncbi:MAG: MBL fold metallo-hydrolase [Elusimicrobiota bacterium]
MSGIRVHFWGTRGSIPVPGKGTVRYGGNTSCVEINDGKNLFICDCGTGIRELGRRIMAETKGAPVEVALFVGHTHWDHIQGFPFFIPAYLPKNRVHVYSVKAVGDTFENILRGQMGMNYFPVEVGDMQAQIEFKHTSAEFEVGGVKVRTMYTNHPGVNVTFRFDYPGGKSVVYLTDHENHQAFGGKNELMVRQDDAIEEFCRGVDLLIADSQYSDADYKMKKGWGHSRWRDALNLGMAAGAKRLALFHHEPDRNDDEIDKIVQECREVVKASGSKLDCFAASENEEVIL